MCIIMHRSVLAFMVYCNVFVEHCNTGTITEGQGHWARAFPAYNEQAPPPCFLRNNIQTHATRWRQKQPQTHNYKYPLFVAKLSVCFLQRQSFTCLQFCLHVFCFTSVVEMFCFALRSCEAPTTPTSVPIMREGAKVDQPFPPLCDRPAFHYVAQMQSKHLLAGEIPPLCQRHNEVDATQVGVAQCSVQHFHNA